MRIVSMLTVVSAVVLMTLVGCSEQKKEESKPISWSNDYKLLEEKIGISVQGDSCTWREWSEEEGRPSFFLPSRYIRFICGTIQLKRDNELAALYKWRPYSPEADYNKTHISDFPEILPPDFSSNDKWLISNDFPGNLSLKTIYHAGFILLNETHSTVLFFLQTV